MKTSVITYIKRVICLLLGLFILTFGIALSAKSGLGVGPTSSLAYVLSQFQIGGYLATVPVVGQFFPITMGEFTFLMNVLFVLLQIAILRKNYKPVYLLQLVVVFFFSFFTDFTLWLVRGFAVEVYWQQLLLAIVSDIIMAVGVFLEVRAGLITMATEGFIKAISDVFHIDFGTMKMILDWGMVVISAAISLIAWHKLVGVREGTILAAFLVGFIVRFFNRHLTFIYPLLDFEIPGVVGASVVTTGEELPLVITIEREWGSGGHEIGQKLAEKLGIPFYDYALITETANQMGLEPDVVQSMEQKVGTFYSLYDSNYATSQMTSVRDAIFEAQKKVIRDFADQGSCVIVGRLGSYVLRNRPNCFHMFVTGEDSFRTKRIAQELQVDYATADEQRKKEDIGRIKHCKYFTGEPWGLAKHYAMTFDSSLYGIDRAVDIVLDALDKHEKNINN